MIKFFQKLNKKTSALAFIMLLFQLVSPAFATANINQLSSVDGIIAICSGFEIKYIKIDENGTATPVNIDDYPQNTPVDISHCDNCILPDVASLSHIQAENPAFRLHNSTPFMTILAVMLKNAVILPPARAPPKI